MLQTLVWNGLSITWRNLVYNSNRPRYYSSSRFNSNNNNSSSSSSRWCRCSNNSSNNSKCNSRYSKHRPRFKRRLNSVGTRDCLQVLTQILMVLSKCSHQLKALLHSQYNNLSQMRLSRRHTRTLRFQRSAYDRNNRSKQHPLRLTLGQPPHRLLLRA